MRQRKVLVMMLGAALALVPSLLAAAEDRPQAQPIRDVTVEYSLKGSDDADPGRARTIKVYWAGGGAHMRVDMEGERSYVILDRDKKLMTVVLLDQHGYVELPYDPSRLTGFTVPPGIELKRAGTEVVVGNPCADWVEKTEQGSTLLCVTDDGVLLHSQGRTSQRGGELIATSMTYGPPGPTVFVPPADFQKLAAPHGAGGARPPG